MKAASTQGLGPARRVLSWLLLVGCAAVAHGSASTATSLTGANPVRKVVALLQSMQKKVELTGEKAKEQYESFECYCKKNEGDLEKSTALASTKVEELRPNIEAAISKQEQLKKELTAHKADREQAEQAVKEASTLRENEKAAFDKTYAESKANIGSLTIAIAALEKGTGTSFLQSDAANHIKDMAANSESLSESDRNMLITFLSGGESDEYNPDTGDIIGTLKQMKDEMSKSQVESVDNENSAVASFEDLTVAKQKELRALVKAIEEKLNRVGELGVQIATLKNDLDDTQSALFSDQKFQVELREDCAKRKLQQEKDQKMRTEELLAIADTIKLLNDDDALDKFSKTLGKPKEAVSFLQLSASNDHDASRQTAVKLLSASRSGLPKKQRLSLDFISLALRGKKVGLDEVKKMIENLSKNLKKEQVGDDNKKTYCIREVDLGEDKQKAIQQMSHDLQVSIADGQEGMATLKEEILGLQDGIKALDKAVVEATTLRKQENAEFKALMADNGAAKDILVLAKKRLNKFYAPDREVSLVQDDDGHQAADGVEGGEAAEENNDPPSFLQIDALPQAPETAPAYSKQSETNSGVIQMMQVLIAGIDKEMTVAQTEEKNSQAAYEQILADSSEKRKQDSKSLTDKEASLAAIEASVGTDKASLKASGEESMEASRFLMSLHADCDWLMKYYDERKAARTEELESLDKAKDVLSGADYSFEQQHLQRFWKPKTAAFLSPD